MVVVERVEINLKIRQKVRFQIAISVVFSVKDIELTLFLSWVVFHIDLFEPVFEKDTGHKKNEMNYTGTVFFYIIQEGNYNVDIKILVLEDLDDITDEGKIDYF